MILHTSAHSTDTIHSIPTALSPSPDEHIRFMDHKHASLQCMESYDVQTKKETRQIKAFRNTTLCSLTYPIYGSSKSLTIKLTYSNEQSTSWEAKRFSASQEIPRILRNPNVHYHVHQWPPPVPILSHLDPVHTPTSYFLNIHLNIILPFTPGSPRCSLSLRFPHHNPVYASPSSQLHIAECHNSEDGNLSSYCSN